VTSSEPESARARPASRLIRSGYASGSISASNSATTADGMAEIIPTSAGRRPPFMDGQNVNVESASLPTIPVHGHSPGTSPLARRRTNDFRA
jgi:hypothetical protein